MIELTSSQRTQLSSAAQTVKPLVQVGQGGVTEGLTGRVDQCLAAHELIKIKFLEFKEDKQSLAQQLADSCHAALVRIIGNVAVLYRPSDKPEKRQYGILFEE
jgi:RNA-binding protein